jgi:hypothetical protein
MKLEYKVFFKITIAKNPQNFKMLFSRSRQKIDIPQFSQLTEASKTDKLFNSTMIAINSNLEIISFFLCPIRIN